MVYMGSQKSSGDHFLGAVFNQESHGDLRFSPIFPGLYTVIELQRQTSRRPSPPPPFYSQLVDTAQTRHSAVGQGPQPERVLRSDRALPADPLLGAGWLKDAHT